MFDQIVAIAPTERPGAERALRRSRASVRRWLRPLVAAVLFGLLAGLLPPTPAPAAPRSALGDVTTYTIPTAGSLPERIIAGPDGNLWFTEGEGHRVGRVTVGGAITEFPIPNASNYPNGLVEFAITSAGGNLWVSHAPANQVVGENDSQISKITPVGTVNSFIVPQPPFNPAHTLSVGSDGNLWFSSGADVGGMTPSGSFFGRLSNTPTPVVISGYKVPNGSGLVFIDMTLGPDGSVWWVSVPSAAADTASYVGSISPAGAALLHPIPTASMRPTSITAGPDGNLWFTEQARTAGGLSKIGRLVPGTGTITEFPLPSPSDVPLSITAGPDGNLWFTEPNSRKLGRIKPGAPNTIDFFPLQNLLSPNWITSGPDGNLWFTTVGNNVVGRFEVGASRTPGAVGGQVLDGTVTPAHPLAAATVDVCQFGSQFQPSGYGPCVATQTDQTGTYAVTGLAGGQYVIRGFAPSGVNLPPKTIGPITVVAASPDRGARQAPPSGQNVTLGTLTPPPAGTAITPPQGTLYGVPRVSVLVGFGITTTQAASCQVAYFISQNGKDYISGAMTEGPPGTYTGGVPVLKPTNIQDGPAQVRFRIDCGGNAVVTPTFDIYIDPSGYVRTVSGDPIPGATVTLYRATSAGGPFTVVPNGDAVMAPGNRANPDTTDSTGHFGWDVIAGFYKVRAEKAGCVAPSNPAQSFVESAVLTIPPAVNDLDLRLSCPAAPTGIGNLRFVTPVRVVDTRGPGFGPIGFKPDGTAIAATPLTDGSTARFKVAGQTFGATTVPTDATGVLINVTLVQGQASGGFVTVYPGDAAAPPNASTVNPSTAVAANFWATGLAPAGRPNAGTIAVTNIGGARDLLIDLVGYYSPTAPAGPGNLRFVTPVRVLDTRAAGANGTGPIGFDAAGQPVTAAPLPAGATRDFTLAGKTFGSGAGAVTFPADLAGIIAHVTIVQGSASGGFVTLLPGGSTGVPGTSTVNPSTPIAFNAWQVGIPAGGQAGAGRFSLYSTNALDAVVDVVGYYAPSNGVGQTGVVGGLSFVTPARALDTRGPGFGPIGFTPAGAPIAAGQLPAGSTTRYLVAGQSFGGGTVTLPTDVKGVLANVTLVQGTPGGGFVTVFPGDAAAAPNTSTVNPSTAIAASFWASGVPAAPAANPGTLGVTSIGGVRDVLIDIVGYFR